MVGAVMYQSDHTQPLPPPAPWWRGKRNIVIGVIAGVVVLCCGGTIAIAATGDNRKAPAPASLDASGSNTPGPSPSDTLGSSQSPTPTAATPPAPARPTDAEPRQPPPADDAGTPTGSGIRAGEFCKKVLAGTYAYDSRGELLYCGPPGASHPRWSHA